MSVATTRSPGEEEQAGRPAAARSLALRDTTPFAIALVPFSLAIGTASAASGLSWAEAIFGAAALLAGTSQLAAVESIGAGGGAVIAVTTVILINIRFAFYGAGLARWFADAPQHHKLLLAIPLVDQSFLLCEERFTQQTTVRWRRQYYLTVSALLLTAFIGCQIIGYQLGSSLPSRLGLHLAAPLAFAGMLAKASRGQTNRVTASVAGMVTVLIGGVAGSFTLPLAVALGIGVGSVTGRDRP